MKILFSIILMMIAIVALFFAAMRTYKTLRRRARLRRQYPDRWYSHSLGSFTWFLYGTFAVLAFIALILPDKQVYEKEVTVFGWQATMDVKDAYKNGPAVIIDPDEEEAVVPVFTATGVSTTHPLKFSVDWDVISEDRVVSSYIREEPISFGTSDEYFALPGVATFRGSNYRNNAAYGTANIEDEKFTSKWSVTTGALTGTSWAGSGWTGQPLIVQWDDETRQIMNLFPDKKNKANLVEVIYATQDGCIYFLDLEDGSNTREPLVIGQCFNGSGALDPRGYPLLYVGSGDSNSLTDRPKMYIISLIDGSILYTYGDNDRFALREDHDGWCAFDASPLVDAETDTLIWPGESGILYTIKLNTNYSKETGKISIAPDAPVATRYKTSRSSAENYWYGYEASPTIVENYLYISENGGMFYCVDLNTMELVWVQDTQDDSNSSPAFEFVSQNKGYIYTAPTLNWTQDEEGHGTINIYKLDAVTGEIIWQTPYEVYTVSGSIGGVNSSPIVGEKGTALEGLVIYTIARTPTLEDGIMVALDTETGNEVWRFDLDGYTWSSPVAIYEEDGTAYIVVCTSSGYTFLIDGSTGKRMYSTPLGFLIEASPAVFNDTIVVGTRAQKIWALQIS